MGISKANAKVVAGKVVDAGGNAEMQKVEDGTWVVRGWLPGATFTTAEAEAVAALASPAAVARANSYIFTDV
jgi:hypothetical protein